MAAVITVDHLHKTYGRTVAVDDLSFEVEEGEIFGILGPNGAGKTTTVECVQGLRDADGGTIRVLGLDPRTEAAELRQRIGSQLQDSALPGRLQGRRVPGAVRSVRPQPGRPRPAPHSMAVAGAARPGLRQLVGRPAPAALHRARRSSTRPSWSSSTSSPKGSIPRRDERHGNSSGEIRHDGTTVVLVTHFMDEAEHLCDRVAVVDDGRVIALDTPQGLIDGLGLRSVVRFTTPEPDLSWVERLDVVESLTRRGDTVEVRGTGPVLALVASELVAHGIVPLDLRVDRPTVEDAFLSPHRTDDPRLMRDARLPRDDTRRVPAVPQGALLDRVRARVPAHDDAAALSRLRERPGRRHGRRERHARLAGCDPDRTTTRRRRWP